jgi:prepilin-type N-terminal cleavage/methylation domain-containing protein
MRREQGFTLIELLVTISLVTVIMTLGAQALRHYWLINSLEQAEGEIISQLRQLQERVVSETHPLVYGARFQPGAANSQWQVVKYDPKSLTTASDDTCIVEGARDFSTGVYVTSASFSDPSSATATCRAQISGAASDPFVFFFAKGTATGGQLTIRQPAIDRARAIVVTALTGRVET